MFFYVHAVSVTYTHNTVPAGAFRGRIRTGHVNRPRDPIVRETRIHLYYLLHATPPVGIQRPFCDKMASCSHFVGYWPGPAPLAGPSASLCRFGRQPSWRHRNGLFRCPPGSGSRTDAPPDGRQAIGSPCRRASDLARWRLLCCRSSMLPAVMKTSAVSRYQRLGGAWLVVRVDLARGSTPRARMLSQLLAQSA